MKKKLGRTKSHIAGITQALMEGARTPYALSYKTGVSPTSIIRIVREHEITLPPDFQYSPRQADLDSFVAQGATLQGIADVQGVTREQARQYIELTGQYESWKQKRREAKTKQKAEKNSKEYWLGSVLPRILDEIITKKCQQQGFAYEKAWDYFHTGSTKHHFFMDLVTFFDNYNYSQKILDQFGGLDGAKRHGVKPLSLAELCEPFGWGLGHTGYILRKVGLEPLNGKCETPSRKVTQAKKSRIISCFDSPLSQPDLAYFAGIKSSSVYKYFSGKKAGWRRTKPIRTFNYHGGEHSLTYHFASQIYEAQDAGFNSGEIEDYTKTHTKAVAYALEHRAEIAPVIVDVLKKLYTGEPFETPYRYTYNLEEVIAKKLFGQ